MGPHGTAPDSSAPDSSAPNDAAPDGRVAAPPEAAGTREPFTVRNRVTWQGIWRLVAPAILFAASAVFATGGVLGGGGVGGVAFLLLGVAGLAVFGAGLLVSAGGMLARRPVLELDGAGVRRPARWPLPRRSGRELPWDEVAAIVALRRGAGGTRRGEQDYLVFLPSPELAELARTAERPALVALTMRDVPATAAAVPWCFAVEQGWDATLPEIVRQARRRRRVPVIDRRAR